ncbi:MAG: DJ-1 family glyoxalase III [Treponema sp.]
MKTVVVFLADGFEEIEAVTVIDYLRRAGVKVTTLATGKNNCTVEGAHKIFVAADETLLNYLSSSGGKLPDAVYLPGGMPGASNIAECDEAVKFIKQMDEEGRLVTAICASPAIVLPKTGALKNKKWTCYPGMKDNAGSYVSTHKDNVPFVTDKNLITGRGPGAAEQFAMELVRVLTGESAAQKVKSGACQR